MSHWRRAVCPFLALAGLLPPTVASSQPLTAVSGASALGIEGRAIPKPPAVIARDESGGVTIRATRVTEPLVLDGRLDEEMYGTVPAISDFIQQEPDEGAPATDRTEAWIFFDEKNVYVGVRCWSTDPERIVANSMQRDSQNIFQNDNIGLAFDTFYDRRNGVFFQTNALGGLRDGLINDETNVNYDWNTEWDVRSRRFEQGWTTELAIPFKSLRYRKGREQVWGFNLQRIVRGKNEMSYIQQMPPSYGPTALFRLSSATTLVGIEAPASSLNLQLKPYVISDLTTNRVAQPSVSNEVGGNLGADVKYGLSKSLTLDFTYNTDFAQVEADDQQVNLTRFSLFVAEKREFFLEGQGIFSFGGASAQVASSGSGGPGETPLLFYSRRIGLEDGQSVPIEAGGRLTGRAGKYAIGLLNVQTGPSTVSDAPSTNFSVLRVKRNILRRSSIGVLATQRAPSASDDASNQVAGVDANLAFYQNLQIDTYYARTRTAGVSGDDESYRGNLEYAGDRYGVEVDHLKVGDVFNPEIGYLRRRGFRRNFADLRFTPRPKSLPAVRKLWHEISVDHIVDRFGAVQTRQAAGIFKVLAANGDTATASYLSHYEFLPAPFPVAKDINLPVGPYRFGETIISYQLGPQRGVTGTLTFTGGGFYSGERTGLGYQGRVELTRNLAVEPRLSFDQVRLPEGDFSTTLVSTRTTYTMTPRMFLAALLQYNSSATSLGANIRFRWEYQPGSDLFLVFGEGRDTAGPAFSALQNRSFVVKYTRLFRF